MKSSSLKLIKDAGVASPSEYRDNLIHNWYLSEEYSKHLTMHILRETESLDFFKHFSKDGELQVKEHFYSVTWINSPATIRKNKYCLVSLRYCPYLGRGYALVKVLFDSDKSEFPKLEYV